MVIWLEIFGNCVRMLRSCDCCFNRFSRILPTLLLFEHVFPQINISRKFQLLVLFTFLLLLLITSQFTSIATANNLGWVDFIADDSIISTRRRHLIACLCDLIPRCWNTRTCGIWASWSSTIIFPKWDRFILYSRVTFQTDQISKLQGLARCLKGDLNFNSNLTFKTVKTLNFKFSTFPFPDFSIDLPSIRAVWCNKHLNFIRQLPREGFVPFRVNSLAAPLAHVGHSMLAEIIVLFKAELGWPSIWLDHREDD